MTIPIAAPGPVVLVPAKPYEYELPVRQTALILIDFQKDFMCEGGFGAALGNDVSQLQVSDTIQHMLQHAAYPALFVAVASHPSTCPCTCPVP